MSVFTGRRGGFRSWPQHQEYALPLCVRTSIFGFASEVLMLPSYGNGLRQNVAT